MADRPAVSRLSDGRHRGGGKKLIAAVRLWAAGGGPSAESREARGAAEAALGILAADEGPPPDFEVWPQNWDAFRLFAAAGTQWERAGMAGARVGLKYQALDFIAAKIGVEISTAVFERLRAAESAALEYWSEKTP